MKCTCLCLIASFMITFRIAEAKDRVNGPLVLKLEDRSCEFLARGKSRKVKGIQIGVEPQIITVSSKRKIGNQTFHTAVLFGVFTKGTSKSLCKYIAFRIEADKITQTFRTRVGEILREIKSESLSEFCEPKNEIEQKLFERFIRGVLAKYAEVHGMVVITAKFDLYAKKE